MNTNSSGLLDWLDWLHIHTSSLSSAYLPTTRTTAWLSTPRH